MWVWVAEEIRKGGASCRGEKGGGKLGVSEERKEGAGCREEKGWKGSDVGDGWVIFFY